MQMLLLKKVSIVGIISFFAFCCLTGFSADKNIQVKQAVPVWADGREKELNLNLGFRAIFTAKTGQDVKIKISASTIYRVFMNGKFIGSGPARAAHGYFRIDEYPVGQFVKEGENVLAIEVAGYNINSYYTLDQPSFLLAETEINGKVVLATGSGQDFEAFQMKERLQKVERYSFQRPFSEYYRMKEDYDRWRTSSKIAVEKLKLTQFPTVRLLPRNVAMPEFEIQEPVVIHSKGTVKKIIPQNYHKDRALTGIGKTLKGFTEEELEVYPVSQEIQEIVTASQEVINKTIISGEKWRLKKDEYNIYDFGTNFSGFIGTRLKCSETTRLILYFDEILIDGDVKTKQRQSDICNHIVYELQPGEYDLETLESYTFKYLKVIVLKGECQIEKIYLREFAWPDNKKAFFASSNDKLNKIFNAAKQTFRQNAVDVFMDCPSRERAGWLCDSYFSSITERELTGHSAVSYNFLENYALPERFAFLPEGMIPMCYPADHNDGNFIPNWSLWFILQVEDYARHGGDPELIARLKPRIEKLLTYFSGFENEDGLLEKLERWVFVEWSKANEFVQDVNYPTNMLYSAALASAGSLYGNTEWIKKAEDIRKTVLHQSYNGDFFVDNAVRENGKLKITGNTTEVCQYYAFFFNLATPDSHPELWKKLVYEFGPDRNDTVAYPDVFRANAFMGNYMRMDILSRYNLQSRLIMEIQDFFYPMADKTGTLWEHMQSYASCNHGFASYIGHVLYRDISGIKDIDYMNKNITIHFTDLTLEWCKGSIPVGEEVIKLEWSRSNNTIQYALQTPVGYNVKIENESSARLIPIK
ncbi:alpha-L-rhamnosidase [Porphyromonadaceae bacterium KH3CP3RA]|nr:alpha-L-rhamnosidase [Porphyromonadaceae bacterium KH3CP3RA]